MDQRELEALVVKISMFANRVNELGDHVAKQSQQATEQLTHTAKGLSNVADQSVARIVEGVEQSAAKSISAGANMAVSDILQRLGNGVQLLDSQVRQMIGAVNTLEHRVVKTDRAHVATAWKGFIGLLIGALAIVGASTYMVWSARQDLGNLKWAEQVQAAETAGKLAQCPEGAGICALDGKKWVRLDSQ
ncbi:hypothetical protein [Rhodanobacter sp. BL-MT-08]